MQLFQTYEREWSELSDSLYFDISRLSAASIDEKARLGVDIRERLGDAKEALEGMKMAARSAQGPQKTQLLQQAEEHEDEWDRLQTQFRRGEQAFHADAGKALFGVNSDDDDFGGRDLLADSSSDRSNLSVTTNLLHGAGSHIEDATRSILETEDVAVHIMEDLDEQRTMVESFQLKLDQINEGLDKAGALMAEMMKRLCGNKIMMYSVAFILFLGIIAVVWLRFFPPWKGAAAGNVTTVIATTMPSF